MAAISAQAFAVVGKPDGRVVVLGAGEEEIAVPVVFQERQWPLMTFHQNRPHLSKAPQLTHQHSGYRSIVYPHLGFTILRLLIF